MKKKHLILFITLILVIGVLLTFLLFFIVQLSAAGMLAILFSCEDTGYYEETNWNCSSEEFYEEYIDTYEEKIQELKQKYNIECFEEKKDDYDSDDDIVKICLYNEEFTLYIGFANRTNYGDFWIDLYYYGTDEKAIDDYENQKNLVDFINELTHYVGFDTKENENSNYYEKLYFDVINGDSDKKGDRYNYHFDHLVGELGWQVVTDSDSYEHYYQMTDGTDRELTANLFSFKGLLRKIGDGH